MNIKFGVFWKQNLGTIYKDNSITTLGKEADVDLNLSEVSSIHANFKVDGKNYTSIVYIVDIEKGLIRIPFTREVLSIGMHELELVAVMKNGDVIPSQTFTYNIVESLDNLEDITEETNYPILIQLLQDVNSKIAEIDDAIARIPSPEELKGEKGDKGDKGEQGIQGERGLQGIQGIRGEKGDKGDRGLQGIQGVKGEKGDKGERGERGLQGIQGNQGARGIQGEKGDKGETGVGLGFEWSGTRLGIKKDTDISYKYVELKGAKGEQGAKGEKGDTPSITHLEKQISDKSKELDTKFNTLTAKQQQDAEVVTARDGEVSLHARLERDLAKGKIHFVDVEGSSISVESEEGYLENVEIHGNTWQDANNLSDIRSVGTKVEGQELYKIPVLSCGKNLFNKNNLINGKITTLNGVEVFECKDDANFFIYNGNFKQNTQYYFHIFFSREIGQEDKLINFVVEYTDGTSSYNNGYHSDGRRGFATEPNKTVRRLRGSFNYSKTFYINLEKTTIEEGTQATPYEPYTEDKLTILSPTPLEKVGNVADRIVCKDGVWGVEKNIGTFTPKNATAISSPYGNDTHRRFDIRGAWDYSNNKGATNLNSFGIFKDTALESNTIECVSLGTSVNYNFMVWIKLDRLISQDLKGINKFLDETNMIVKYIYAQSQFIPLPHDQQIKLRTFANKTHIHFKTEIQPTLKAQVPKSLGATVNSHTSQIDNLNKELDRVKKLEESTVSTVTSCKTFTTVSETTQGYFEDVRIEGKTLVNRYLFGNLYISNNNDEIRIFVPNKISNGVYTIVNYANKAIMLEIYDNNDGHFIKNIYIDPSSNTAFTLSENEGFNIIKGLQNHGWDTNSEADKEAMKKQLILEGDHTDKDISFFEGLKSVGQDADEISVSSVNNDYFNYYLDKEPTKTYFRLNKYITTGAVIKNISQNPIKCLAYKNGVWNKDVYLRKNEVYVVETEYDVRCLSIATGDNWNVSKDYFLSDIIEISVYKQDKKQILYYNPTTQTWGKPVLREWDSIEKHSDGKYYYHKRSGEVVLNGSENWSLYSNGDSSTNYIGFRLSKGDVTGVQLQTGIRGISDKFNYIESYTELNQGLKEGLYCGYNAIVVGVNRTKLSSQDVAGFKSWLQTNPVTVVYQLAQEEVYECANLDLITYSGETNLIVNSGVIQPKLELKVLSNVSNVVKLLQEKVSILENKFIKGLQQVLAGDMMSLAHLLYPEDFENNHEIQTLEL